MTADKSSDEDNAPSLVHANALVNITDIFGLGTAAKSDASKEIVRVLSRLPDAFARPLGIYLEG